MLTSIGSDHSPWKLCDKNSCYGKGSHKSSCNCSRYFGYSDVVGKAREVLERRTDGRLLAYFCDVSQAQLEKLTALSEKREIFGLVGWRIRSALRRVTLEA